MPIIFTFLNLSTSIGKSTTEKEAGGTRSHCKLATTQTDSKAVSLFGLGPPAELRRLHGQAGNPDPVEVQTQMRGLERLGEVGPHLQDPVFDRRPPEEECGTLRPGSRIMT